MSYRPDPGGNLASDTHRWVLGVAWNDEARTLTDLGLALSVANGYHELETLDDLEEVLKDLEADGFVTQTKGGWKRTDKGLEAITAPPVESSSKPSPALLGGLEK